MKDNADKKNLAKYKNEIANLTDREVLEEKAYFTFATYRVLEKIHTIAVIFLTILLISVLIVVFSYLTK
ncbi:hypothetical protein [Myroides odoratimimus]|uniref:hypothetical protein n=1 Tax=Myroides odoratimimus TaxID=76832 RepID=UPI002576B6F1|nr:hypothetical protein [Myroides odoratimimus]MDM1060840.1 hypothetical protein [Myroides odoratimimus]